MKKNKILILTAPFGYGHNKVAENVKNEVLSIHPNAQINTVNILDFFPELFSNFAVFTYITLTKHMPKLYNYFYYSKNNYENSVTIDDLIFEPIVRPMAKYISLEKPDLIVSTFPSCSLVISKIKKRYHSKLPLVTIITDIVCGKEWVHPLTDQYLVPSFSIRTALANKGVSKDKITVTGIPVGREFTEMSPSPKNNVLIMGSAMNKMKIDQTTLDNLSKLKNIHFTIVTGSNKDLYNQLLPFSEEYSNISILGYTRDMSTLLSKSMLIVTKPGGVTLFESIHKGVPLLINDSGLGQELANVDFIRNHEIGICLNDSTTLAEKIQEIIGDPILLPTLQSNIEKIRCQLQFNKIGERLVNSLQ